MEEERTDGRPNDLGMEQGRGGAAWHLARWDEGEVPKNEGCGACSFVLREGVRELMKGQ
jgi:hypothetical protein